MDPVERRLIPAHAGKTAVLSTLPGLSPAHPRACGENDFSFVSSRFSGGSSPRMRGKLVAVVADLVHNRLIPAHAGKTRIGEAIHSSGRAHPRACGENPHTADTARASRGSSPRMRGKRIQEHGQDVLPRLIPAHAGKTNKGKVPELQRRAHPRACGENRRRHRVQPR